MKRKVLGYPWTTIKGTWKPQGCTKTHINVPGVHRKAYHGPCATKRHREVSLEGTRMSLGHNERHLEASWAQQKASRSLLAAQIAL